jgi:uncharacterized protein (TIGR03083 family)
MTNSPVGDPLVELRYALAHADAMDPPNRVIELVTDRARAARRPGRRVEEPEGISAAEVFSRAVDVLDELLGAIGVREWKAPALRGLDVQGLVGHLIGVETDFQASLQDPLTAASTTSDHVQATEQRALAQRGRAPARTYRDWQVLVRRTLEMLAHHSVSEEVSLHGLTMPLDALLVVRAFELWTHTEDIERSLNRDLSPPDASSLQRMVDLAVELLPRVLPSAVQSFDPATVRLVLIGHAGGTFDIPFNTGQPSPPRAHIVADAVEFCRLVANRLRPTEVALSLSGEVQLAELFLAGATNLSLD